MSFNRIVSGAFVSYLNTAFSLISNLILVPMYLFYFGKEEYGLWLVVLSIVNYLGFSNFGIAQSVANLVASANAKSNFNEINIIAATGFWLYACIIFVIMVIVCGGLFVVEIEDFLNIPDSLKNVVIPVLVISSASFLLKLPLTIFNVTLRSLNLIYKEQLFGLVFTIIQTIGVVVILLSGTGIVGLSIVYGLTGLFSSLVLGLYLYKSISGFSISRKFVSRKMVGRLIDPSIYFFLLQIGGAFIAGTDNIVITANIGVAEVASYAVAFQVCYIATRLISVITASALPSITSIYASNDRDHLSIVYIQILRSCFGFGLLIIFVLFGVGPSLMVKWIGVENYVGNITFYFIACFTFISIILYPSDVIMIATTNHKGYAIMTIIEGILNLILSVWWIHLWGVAGVAAATIFGRITTNGWYMFYSCYKITGIGLDSIIRKVIKPYVIPILGTLIATYFLNIFELMGWYRIIITTISLCFIFTVLFYSLSLSNHEKVILKSSVKRYCGLIGNSIKSLMNIWI